MLELYHNINSVCAQKVRIALFDKGLEVREHLLTLGGDQFDPAYLKLNPNALVPTLVHDGKPVVESSLILYYLDETFPAPALMPTAPGARYRARMFNKLIDEYVHVSCMTLTFATAFRGGTVRMDKAKFEADLKKAPNQKRSDIKRDVAEHGLDSKYVKDALQQHEKLLTWMDESLAGSDWLAGAAYSLADIAVIPYILRLDLLRLARLWDDRPAIQRWYERMRARPSFRAAVLDRMSDADSAPFRNLKDDPWAKVKEILAA
jgi:glutathione S-transferase